MHETPMKQSISCTRRCLQQLEKCKTLNHIHQSHAQLFTSGLSHNPFALIRLLALCPIHHHSYALKLFHHIPNPKPLIIYNTLLKTLTLKPRKALQIFTHMLQNQTLPDNYTLPYLLKASIALQSLTLGSLLHGFSFKLGFDSDLYVGNSLMLMYCGFHNVGNARNVFDEMPRISAVSWSVMISGFARVGDVDNARVFFDEAAVRDKGIWGAMVSGYVKNGCFKEGLYLFRAMLEESGVVADEAVLVSVLCACANLGDLDVGIWVHRYLKRKGIVLSVRLGTGLVDMYAKCGELGLARGVFCEMQQRDTVCWNAMISGLAMHGDGESALVMFKEMEVAGVWPDNVTFIAVFTACSYAGMAYEGMKLLDKMCSVYKIRPKSEHYGCIVDLLSRAGLFEEAREIIGRIPSSIDPSEEAVAWRAFLSACCNHGQAELAEVAAEKLFWLESHSGVYVLLSNLYAAAGKHGDARRMRNLMRNRGVDKVPGCSLVEIDRAVYEFIAGEKTHPRMEEIQLILQTINKQMEHFGSNKIL